MSGKTDNERAWSSLVNQVITVTIGCLLLGLVGYRYVAGFLDHPTKIEDAPAAVIELSVETRDSEIYFFPAVPTLDEVLKAGGADGLAGVEYGGLAGRAVSNGEKVSLVFEGGHASIIVEPMDAGKRITLGIPIDLNTATAQDLILISGIGPKSARAIIEFRDGVGSFERIEQLEQVNGIGRKRFQWIRKYVFVGRG